MVMTREVKTTHQFNEKPNLGFEHVTMVPLCQKLIDVKLLTPREKQWVNDYHKEVWHKTSDFFKNDERTTKWLKRKRPRYDDDRKEGEGERAHQYPSGQLDISDPRILAKRPILYLVTQETQRLGNAVELAITGHAHITITVRCSTMPALYTSSTISPPMMPATYAAPVSLCLPELSF